MRPPDSSRDSHAPPAYQYPPGQYQPAYPYPYPYPPPPPAKGLSTRTIVLIVVVVVVLVIVVPLILAGVLMVYMQTMPSQGGSTDGFTGIRAEKTAGGDWLIYIITGNQPASSLTLQVTNSSTGQLIISKHISSIKYPSSDPDAVYNDYNGNNKVDAADTILLKASGGHVHAGDKVQLLKGDIIIATVNALPA